MVGVLIFGTRIRIRREGKLHKNSKGRGERTMIKIGIWILIIIALLLLRKRIGDVILGIGLLFSLTVFAVFMLDEYTVFDTRKYLPMGEYDRLTENPKEVAEEVTDKVKGAGGQIVGKVNDRGDELDERYGTGLDETDEEGKKDTKKEKEKGKEGKEQQEKVKKEPTKPKKEKGVGRGFTYSEVGDALDKYYPDMGEYDRALVLSLVPMLEMAYVGEDYKIWNSREDGKVYIQELE